MSLALFTGQITPDKRERNPKFHEKCYYGSASATYPDQSSFQIIADLLMGIADNTATVEMINGDLWIAGSEQKHGSVWLEITPDGKLTLGEPG